MDATNLKGFARLTHLYPQRQAMKVVLKVSMYLKLQRPFL